MLTTVDGEIISVNTTSYKIRYRFHPFADNQFLALDLNADGSLIATGNHNGNITLFSDETQQVVRDLRRYGQGGGVGHQNRVFGLKFQPDDRNVIVSGGRDGQVIFWDIREPRSLFSFDSHRICGDALDIRDNKLLVASDEPSQGVRVYDIGKRELWKQVKHV